MTPQFVDLDADGFSDVFAATFDGSPHLALGSEEGFRAPEHLTDSEGGRVMLSQYWDYERESWEDSGQEPNGHCTSAWAFDWDQDGDLDLLLADYRSGRVFLRRNTGGADDPVFDGTNVPVQAGGASLELAGGVASLQVVDWDGDGLADLLLGGYGDVYGSATGGGIHWCRNVGKAGAPDFTAPETLIERSLKGRKTPTRPDSGLHLQAVDWNGDGALDLLVGGYTHWKPEAPTLTAEQAARADELERFLEGAQDRINASYAKIFAPEAGLPADRAQQALDEWIASEEYQTLGRADRAAESELDTLRPGDRREGSVWVYLREK